MSADTQNVGTFSALDPCAFLAVVPPLVAARVPKVVRTLSLIA